MTLNGDGFSVSFSDREVTAWGGLDLLKRMLEAMEFRQAMADWSLPEPGSNRGYDPPQLLEQFIVSIWCGACRFAHAETVRMDGTLTRLFGWQRAAGHKAIMRLFGRFDMLTNERVQAEVYRWFFSKISALKNVTLDVDSTVITRNGQQEGAVRGYNPGRRGRASHHPLLAFVAEARMVVNFWLRPGNTHSSNNMLQFLESTLHHLGDKVVGLLRADSGFFDEAIFGALETKNIAYIDEGIYSKGYRQKSKLLTDIATNDEFVFESSSDCLLLQLADFGAFCLNRMQILSVKNQRTDFDNHIFT